MNLKKSINLPTPTAYFQDGIAIYVVFPVKSLHQIVGYDPEIMEPIFTSKIREPVMNVEPQIDEDCIYFATTTGDVSQVDKFSGLMTVKASLGSMIGIDVKLGVDHIYSLCGIPINNGKPQIDSETFCVSINEKESGRKVVQTQSMRGIALPLSLSEDAVWCVIGKTLYKYDLLGELVGYTNLNVLPRYQPVLTDQFVICSSSMGTLEIFDQDMRPHARMVIAENNSVPVPLADDHLLWICREKVHVVDLKKKRSSFRLSLRSAIDSTPFLHKDSLYVGDASGNLIELNLLNYKSSHLKVTNEPLWKPVAVGNHVFIASAKALHQIEVS